MKRCPKCHNKTFLVTAHVTQSWEVDEKENFLKCICECVEVTHTPDDDDLWTCSLCGYNAVGKEFSIKT